MKRLRKHQKQSFTGYFPGSPTVRTPRFHCRGAGPISGQGTRIPHVVCCAPNQKTKKVMYARHAGIIRTEKLRALMEKGVDLKKAERQKTDAF